MIRILIVDDSVAIREGLHSLLDGQPDFEVSLPLGMDWRD